YLTAYCTLKEDYRIFKLTRIIDLEVLEDVFSGHAFPEPDDKSGQDYRTIVLCFPPNMAYRVYDEFDKTQISRQESEDLIVSAKMPEDEWLLGYLLSFGTQVEILEPAYLKKVIADTAKKICEKTIC
ncbi:MAG: WYL domain-containing protein, partial [Lachnospiraceae bacterium]|nr:WYL domain-containing protein [Lachnospiraceae bacterium]